MTYQEMAYVRNVGLIPFHDFSLLLLVALRDLS